MVDLWPRQGAAGALDAKRDGPIGAVMFDTSRPQDRIVEVASFDALTRITRRGIEPTVPPRALVRLTFLKEGAARSRAEVRLGRYGRACGCTAAGVIALTVLMVLVVGRFGFHVGFTLFDLPWAVDCVVAACGLAVIGKLVVLLHARAQLSRLHRSVQAMTEGPPE